MNQFNLRLKGSEKPEAAIKRMSEQIKNFVKLSRREGYKVIGFIDKSISTKETEQKWISRREKELKSGRRKVLVNCQKMIGDMFQSLGVPVHFSTIDCDDTIAAFAFHKKGSVLSQDADFFRYYVESSRETEPPYTVYSDFEMIGGRLTLTSHLGPKPGKPKASPKKMLESLPETRANAYFICDTPDYVKDPPEGVRKRFVRGCGSYLTQETNPHLLARPLRQAVYYRSDWSTSMSRTVPWSCYASSLTPELVLLEALGRNVPSYPNIVSQPAWSTLIGRAPALLRSHWSRASIVMLAPAILCHTEPVRSKQNTPQ